jgi:hypothetical protein
VSVVQLERQVVLFCLPQDGSNEAAVAPQGAVQSLGATKDGSGKAADGPMLGGGRGVDERVFEAQGAFESGQCGVGEVDDDDLGSTCRLCGATSLDRWPLEAGGNATSA